MPITFKGIGDNYGRLHAQFARTGGGEGCCIPVLPVFIQSKGKSRKWVHHIAIFRMELFLLGGIKAESELESESIFLSRSRSRSWSHLKSVDSAALCRALSESVGLR